MPHIDLKDVGPIHHLTLDLPPGGGLAIFRGKNGVGKSTAIDAVKAVLKGKNPGLAHRDRCVQGEIEVAGARMRITKATSRRTGELQVSHLEGDLDLASLVDPGQKNEAAADQRRIKALVGLTGAKADPALFYDLAGGQEAFEAIVKADGLKTDDLVEMAARVKRDLEAAARARESEADHELGHAAGAKESAAGVDVSQPADADEQMRALQEALTRHTALVEQVEAAAKARQRAATAKERMERAQASYQGPAINDAQKRAADVELKLRVCNERMAEIATAMHDAKSELVRLTLESDTAGAELSAATEHDKLLASYEHVIDDARETEPPMDITVAKAEQELEQRRQAVQQGEVVRKAAEALARAERHEAAARTAQQAAHRLRAAAKGTDEVLSRQVACDALRVEGGRLVTDTARGATFFSELSLGERWKIAIDLAIAKSGDNALVVIPQEAYEGLDPINRRAIFEHLRAREVWGLAAEADGGELRAEVYQEA